MASVRRLMLGRQIIEALHGTLDRVLGYIAMFAGIGFVIFLLLFGVGIYPRMMPLGTSALDACLFGTTSRKLRLLCLKLCWGHCEECGRNPGNARNDLQCRRCSEINEAWEILTSQ